MGAISDFIEKIKPVADEVYVKTGVLPSVTIGQAIHETGGNVNNILASKFNFFGEKGKGDLGSVRVQTTEEINGQMEKVYDDFKVYSSPTAAAAGRAKLLQQNNFIDVGKATNYEDQLKLLKAGGYATDSKYVPKVLNVIQEYDLTQFDSPKNFVDGVISKPLEGVQETTEGLKAQSVKFDPIGDAAETIKAGAVGGLSAVVYLLLGITAIVALFLMVGGSGIVKGVTSDANNSPVIKGAISAATKGAV